MPFGLSNAPAIFQGYVNKILAEKLNVFVIVYLDKILIYTKDPGQAHVEAVRWILENLRKHDVFANLKKCRFHQDKFRFLGHVVFAQGEQIEDEKIEAVKSWPEPKSIQHIQVFIGFANFYQRFIQEFSKIATPLTSILKTSSAANIQPQKSTVVDDEAIAGSNISNKKSFKSKNPAFLTVNAGQAFTQLRQAFTKALILQHFDPECHIWIQTDASSYAIIGVLSQLTTDSDQ